MTLIKCGIPGNTGLLNGMNNMKTIELKVRIEVPDDYDCEYPFDTLTDANYRDDMEIIDVELIDD